MTSEDRIKRYKAIVTWGKEFIESVESYTRPEHSPLYDFDRELLAEYIEALEQLTNQNKQNE